MSSLHLADGPSSHYSTRIPSRRLHKLKLFRQDTPLLLIDQGDKEEDGLAPD